MNAHQKDAIMYSEKVNLRSIPPSSGRKRLSQAQAALQSAQVAHRQFARELDGVELPDPSDHSAPSVNRRNLLLGAQSRLHSLKAAVDEAQRELDEVEAVHAEARSIHSRYVTVMPLSRPDNNQMVGAGVAVLPAWWGSQGEAERSIAALLASEVIVENAHHQKGSLPYVRHRVAANKSILSKRGSLGPTEPVLAGDFSPTRLADLVAIGIIIDTENPEPEPPLAA